MSGGLSERYTNFGFGNLQGSPAQQGEIAFMRNFQAFSLGESVEGPIFQAQGFWPGFFGRSNGMGGGGQWWWTLRSVGEMKSKKCFGRKDFVLAFSWRYNDSMIPLSTWSWTVMISKPPKLVRLNSVVSFWKKWTMARNSCYPPFANAPELLMVQKSS